MDPPFQDSASLSVDDANLENLFPNTFGKIIIEKRRHLGGLKRMKIQRVFDGNAYKILHSSRRCRRVHGNVLLMLDKRRRFIYLFEYQPGAHSSSRCVPKLKGKTICERMKFLSAQD